MAFKVRMKLLDFAGDAKKWPCHFEYKIGDEFIYDGEKFTGRVCPWVIPEVFPVIHAIHIVGRKYGERIGFRYMRPAEGNPEAPFRLKAGHVYTERQRGWTYMCPDFKTHAFFIIEPFGLVNAAGAEFGWQYNYEMTILEKIKEEPGLTADKILNKFSEQERERIQPTYVQIMLEELVDADYIEIRDGKAYPTKVLLTDWGTLEKTFPVPTYREAGSPYEGATDQTSWRRGTST
jgi:uncharacterized repeat protein (TIGR04076 family)